MKSDIRLIDIVPLLSPRHSYCVIINGETLKEYLRRDELTYGMLQMYVTKIGSCYHLNEDHLVLELVTRDKSTEG